MIVELWITPNQMSKLTGKEETKYQHMAIDIKEDKVFINGEEAKR
jgi:hypothetical protein